MIGTGDTILTIAAVPLAAIVDADVPSIPIRVVLTGLRIVTRSKFTGSIPERVPVGTPTVAALGKSTVTVSVAALNPFMVCA
jgi:hypothetical protein